MRLTLIQMNIVWGDIAANCRAASTLIDSEPGSDLYVLPEMFSTGFATDPEGLADCNLTSLTWMKEKAATMNAAIAGSVATKCSDGAFRNRFCFVKPDGEFVWYDKHHLFTYGNEQLNYEAGQERVVVEWRGVRFLLQVCYDLRFPVFSRNSLSQTSPSGATYDCAIYVASWPTSRIEVWRTLLKARAIENQCYVVGVNRIGQDTACRYCGGTACVDSYGRVIASCPDDQTSIVTVEMNMQELEKFRSKFPVLADADLL